MAEDFFANERTRLEKIMQAFYRRHSPSHDANAIDTRDADIAAILSSFSYLFANVSTLVNTSHNNFYQLMSKSVLGSLLLAKPSATLIKATGGFFEPTILKKGTKVRSSQLTPKGDEIIFSVAKATTIYPFFFGDFSFAEKSGMIQVKFKITNLASNRLALDFPYLDISFAGSESIVDASRMFLLFYMAKGFEMETSGGVVPIFIDDINPYGYDSASSIYDLPEFELEDTALVMDYCKLPAKLFSFRLMMRPQILDIFRREEHMNLTAYLPMQMKRFFPGERAFSSLSFNMIPVVNLFDEQAVPVRINHYNNLVPLNIAGSKGEKQIYKVREVIGVDTATSAIRQYFDFNEYVSSGNKKALVYDVKMGGLPVSPKFSLQLSYGDEETIFKKESVAATLICSNGVHGEIPAGTLSSFNDESLAHIIFSQDLPASSYTEPMMDTGQAGLLVNELKVSKLDLQTTESLKELLTHLFTLGGATSFTPIEAIQDLKWKQGTHIDEGKLIYGQELALIMDTSKFDDEMGLLMSFGTIISNILASHTPLNFYSRLTFYSSANPTIPVVVLPPVCGDRVLQRTQNTKV